MKQNQIKSRSDQSITPRTFIRNHASPAWIQTLSRFDTPVRWLAIEQLAGTFIPYFSLLFLMFASIRLGASLLITLALAVIAVPFYIRIFIFLHDCGHGSFFHNTKANTILAYVCGIFTFTPYEQWRHDHAIHHLNVSNLDRRGPGEITIMTVDEYLESPMLNRIVYRLYRNPFIMFGLGFLYKFIIANRFPHLNDNFKRQLSVYITDFAIAVIVVTAWLTIGIREYLLIQMPVAFIAGTFGIWIFYVQHNFPGVYFSRQKDWNHLTASMRGASYYKLPPILQWATGNIGFHHLHHVRPRIPNYNLPRSYAETKEVHVKPLTMRRSLDALFLSLWDENKSKLVSFRHIKKLKRKMSVQNHKEDKPTFDHSEGLLN
jgi:acyl-lipid omega-6 desaturase (Delta-12 desaturase)